jgi:abhydrolase domain-containing protein 17
MFRFLWRSLAIVVSAYLIVILLAAALSNRMIFQPQPSGYRDDNEIVKIKSTNGAKISARYLSNPKATLTILFSHGNAEDIGNDEVLLEGLRSIGFSIFAYDYQGYGTSEGVPTEAGAYDDVEAAYSYLTQTLHVPSERIISFGRSVGGGPATELAVRHHLAGLILESAFTSAFRVITRVQLLPFDRFDNLKKISRVHCPVLIIHGTNDSIINVAHGHRLYSAANQPKLALFVEGAGHNDVPYVARKSYSETLKKFQAMIDSGQHP